MTEEDVTTEAYDASARAFADRWYDVVLERALDAFGALLPAGESVLDAGCGPARDADLFRRRGFRAFGIDRSRGMLLEARRRNDVPTAQADLRRLPFPDGAFAGLWLCASLLHVPREEAPAVLAEGRRVLGGGVAFVSVKEGDGERWIERLEGRRLFVEYRMPELEWLLDGAGFCLVEAWTDEPGPGQDRPWLNVVALAR
jgi:SAM-dependent methyltransferase